MPSITVKTNFSPEFRFDPTNKAQTSKLSQAVLRLFQPSIDANLPIVGDLHYAPAGEPNGLGIVTLAFVLGLAVYGGFHVLRKLR